MTHEGMFNEHDDSIKLKKLRKELKKIKADKEKEDNNLKKTIDLLETHATIKDYQILKLREEVTALKEALEKTE